MSMDQSERWSTTMTGLEVKRWKSFKTDFLDLIIKSQSAFEYKT